MAPYGKELFPVPFSGNKKSLSLFDRFFDDDTKWFDSVFSGFEKMFDSCCYKNGEEIVYKLEVPGFNKNNLEVEIGDGLLTITGERKVQGDNHVGQTKLFKRFTIGEIEDAKAEVKDGILTLRLKGKESVSKNMKQIEVKG